MALNDCLASAVAQKAITQGEAEDLARQFDDHLKAANGDAARAKADLEEWLRKQGAEMQRRADLTEAARLNIKQRLMQEQDFFTGAKALLSHYGFRNGSSVRGRAEAIIAVAHAQVADAMFAFRRAGVLGRRINKALVPDFIRALHGEPVNDATARSLAKAVSDVLEDLRLRFNAAGGAMPKLEGFGLPHSHDPLRVKRLGKPAWKQRMLSAIDPARMRDGLTGRPITPAALDRALDHAYDQIVSDSMAHLTPSMTRRGLGAIAERRADERFFVFKDGKAWLDYHREFGRGDEMQALFGHINAMAKDIAAMELLGPNPAAMVEWLKQVVGREFGQKAAGKAGNRAGRVAMLDGRDSEGKMAMAYIDWLWTTLRGPGTVVSGAARFTGSVKNLTASMTLGATGILAGLTDPFIARAARKLAGLPQLGALTDMLKALKRQTREDIIRSGVIWDEYMHVMADELRFGGPMIGSEWSKWVADRAMMVNGLKPLTTGRKLVEARAWQQHIADLAKAGTGFDALDPRLRRTLDGFGITADHWAIWSKSIDGNGFVTPMEIVKRGGSVTYIDVNRTQWSAAVLADEAKALAHREAAEKLAELTTSWSERSVPTGTPNARAVVTAGQQRGTIPGELMDYFLQFKSFGLSFTTMQWEAMAQEGGLRSASGLAYFASMVVPLTLGAAAYLQIKNLLDGKDPEEMDAAFLLKSVLTGGGFGLFGDFIKVTENRFGQSTIEALAGPGLAFLGDSFNLAWQLAADGMGIARQTDDGFGTPTEARQFAQRWTPIASSHPATRAAYNRVVLDNMQYWTDPKAEKAFKRRIAKAKKDGMPYFLPPGSLTPAGRRLPPRRSPDLGNAVRPFR